MASRSNGELGRREGDSESATHLELAEMPQRSLRVQRLV